MENNQISVRTNSLDDTIAKFEKIKELANYVATTETFAKGFEMKDKDGNVIIDETTGKPKINIADVALCIITGFEVGLELGGSILYGRRLNQATYTSIMKGRGMGVDLPTAIEKIITITSKNGNTVSYTMVDIISAKLMQAQIVFLPFIKNYAPFYIYNLAGTTEELELDKILDEDDNLKSEYFLVHAGLIKEQVDKARVDNKILVTKQQHGYYSKARFVRTYPDGHTVTHYQRFTTLDAERAELLPTFGIDTAGKTVLVQGGKDNWIKNTPQMMNNRVISISGRIIASDFLNGIYTREEVVSAGIIAENDAPIVDAEIVS